MAITTVKQIALTELREHPQNPRKVFDPAQLAELAVSIDKQGLLQPLVVRAQNGHYQVIAGARRYRAIVLNRASGAALVSCTVVEADDAAALAIMVAENQQRVDVHPLEEAHGYAGLLKHKGWDVDRIAAHVGKSPSYIYQRLQLAKLTKAAEAAFMEGNGVTAAHAIELARLEPADQKEALVFLKAQSYHRNKNHEGTVGVRDFRRWVANNCHLKLARAGFDPEDAALGPVCSICPQRTGNRPQLFADVADAETCIDAKCYQAKGAAAAARATKVARKAGVALVKISETYGDYQKPILGDNEWKARKAKKDGDGEEGLLVDGPRRGAVVPITITTAGKYKLERLSKAKSGKKAGSKSKAKAPPKLSDALRKATERRIATAPKLRDASESEGLRRILAAVKPGSRATECLHAMVLETLDFMAGPAIRTALALPPRRVGVGSLAARLPDARKLKPARAAQLAVGAFLATLQESGYEKELEQQLARLKKAFGVKDAKKPSAALVAATTAADKAQASEKRARAKVKEATAKAKPKKPAKRKATKKAKKKPAKKK